MKTEQFNYGIVLDRTIKKIRQSIQRRFNEQGFDITVEQWAVLNQICENSGVGQNTIADGTFKDAPTVTRIIDHLCKKNLTIRRVNENDRRRFDVSPTEVGRKLVEQTLPIVVQVRKEGWQHLSEQDFYQLMHILDTIFKNLEQA